ncbi:MAG: ATP-binding protein, partial [Nitrospinota bacterium]
YIQPHIDHLFQRKKYDTQKILQNFMDELVELKGLDELINKIIDTISEVLYIDNISLILYDEEKDIFCKAKSIGVKKDITISPDAPFLKWLEENDKIIEKEEVNLNPDFNDIKEISNEYFDKVEAKLSIPLIHNNKLIGIINLNGKQNLKPYLTSDIKLLTTLKTDATIALSNSLLFGKVQDLNINLEKKVEDRTMELREANEKLKEMDKMKMRFFANISHELRTPLTLTLAPIESMLEGGLGKFSDSQIKYLQSMHNNSLKLLMMINNLLDLAKLEEGKMILKYWEYNIGDLIRKMLSSVSPMAEKKNIEISYEEDGILPKIFIDTDKIEKVLLNLISNSLKFTGEGGKIRINARYLTSIQLKKETLMPTTAGTKGNEKLIPPNPPLEKGGASGEFSEEKNGERDTEEASMIAVSVSDTGIGIPENKLEAVFDRFIQMDQSYTREYGGSGIGLALAKELVEIHNGKIFVESKKGQGTKITFTLPAGMQHVKGDIAKNIDKADEGAFDNARLYKEADWKAVYIRDSAESQSIYAKDIREGAEKKEHTILVVEDNPDMAKLLKFVLKDNYNILLARDGEEGINLTRKYLPDLVLSDIMMPKKNGYELCDDIKSDIKTKHIPIILITSKTQISMKLEGFAHGADDYISKPFNSKELIARVTSFINLHRLEREIQNRNEELEKALRDLKDMQAQLIQSEKLASLGQMMSGLAHEIKNPINIISNGMYSLEKRISKIVEQYEQIKDKPTGDYEEILNKIGDLSKIIQNGINRIKNIVDNFSKFARKDSGKFKKHDIHEGIESTLFLLKEMMGDRIEVHRKFDLKEKIMCSMSQINQAIMNILINAINAIEEKNEKGNIWINTSRKNGQGIISIRDDGTGIPEENKDKIFDPFFTTKDPGKGTGLGLGICYRIIKDHKGKIDLKSELNKGTEFLITLPI